MRSELISCRYCSNTMDQVDMSGIVIDRCPACDSHWFDNKKLAAVFAQQGADVRETAMAGLLRLPSVCRHCMTDNAETAATCSNCDATLGYRCPRDDRPMLVSVHHAVEIDICPQCRGIWLDSEDYELLLENTKSANARDVVPKDLNRPKLTPDWMKTPTGLRGCQLCGVPRLAPELYFQSGLFKCESCFHAVNEAKDTRVNRLTARNQRRYDTRDRPVATTFMSKLLEMLTTPIIGD